MPVPSLALVGAGGIGAYHLASIRKLVERGRARLVAVVEPLADRFTEVRRELEENGVRWYLDYRALLAGEANLDAVTIATPIPFHFDMARACLARGLHVNLEKPPVPLIQQLETLIEEDVAGSVTVGFQMIMSRCVQRMKRLITEGVIGEITSIRACGCWPRRDPYYQRAPWAGKLVLDGQPVFDGSATNALAHLVHNIMFLAGTATDFAVPGEVQGELYRARRIESYDVACLRGTFREGFDFHLAVTHATRDAMPFRLEVRGTKATLLLSDDGGRLQTSLGECLEAADTTQELLDVCHDRFVRCLSHPEERTYTSLQDTRGYVRATNGLLLSSGGIHDLDPGWIDGYTEQGEAGLDVRGLRSAVEQVFTEGRLFSELDLPWAVAQPMSVRLDGFQSVDLAAAAL